jgi:hypothetical protein
MASSFAVSSGCICGACTKRENELCCPTDIRKTHFWCFGEDAIIHGPCGPKPEFYGYEPTCWREFPEVPPCCDTHSCGVPISPPPLNEAPPSSPTEQLPPAPSPQNVDPFSGNLHPVPRPSPPLPEQSSALPLKGQVKVESVAVALPAALPDAPKNREAVPVVTDKNLVLPTSSRVSSATQTPPPTSPLPAAPRQPVFDEQFAPSGVATALIPAPLPRAAATDKMGDGKLLPDELPWTGGEGSTPALQQADGAILAPLLLPR